jgi:hypothetical protein
MAVLSSCSNCTIFSLTWEGISIFIIVANHQLPTAATSTLSIIPEAPHPASKGSKAQWGRFKKK